MLASEIWVRKPCIAQPQTPLCRVPSKHTGPVRVVGTVPEGLSLKSKSMARKRLVLVFPPLSVPTSPPLGMAMLKGYIEKELPDWDVIPCDLNLWTFDFLLDSIRRGALHLTPQAMERMGTDAAGLLRAANVFKGVEGNAFYEMGPAYDARGRAVLEFTEFAGQYLTSAAERWDGQGQKDPILNKMLDHILSLEPDVVGISAIFSHQLPVGAMLGRALREGSGLSVVFGGSCFTEGVEQFLTHYPHSADAIVKGDGEGALKALLQNDMDPTGIPGVFYRAKQEIVSTPSVFQKDIDAFGAPDFSDYDLHAYYSPEPVVPILLTRGCYWRKCTFCVHYFSAGDTYRVGSMDEVINKLSRLVDLGVRNFYFVDEMLAPGYFVKLSEAIREAGLDISYFALSKPNKTFTPKVFEAMARSGCRYIMWGLESGNQRVVDLMGKGTVVEEIPDILANATRAGIYNHLYMICGFPTETRAEFRDTLDFLRTHAEHIHVVHRSLFSLEVGSPIYASPEKFGIVDTWKIADTPLGPRLGYRTSSGMTMEEARTAFQEALPFLRNFNPFGRYLGNYRDHALLVYAHAQDADQPRRFVHAAVHQALADLRTS